ncbi:hypothetical protein M3Y94_00211100 [Aphelenchoides besseyi]|nr:hypothetical protein M3Y94_00211100 [Aphelenchoides besseyi]
MPVFTLQFKAHMENVTNLQPDEFSSHQWSLKLKCTGCREVGERWKYIAADELVEIPHSRGEANYVETCAFCKKHSTINVLQDHRPYSTSDEFQPMVKFECRGTEPVEFQATGDWKCASTLSDTRFDKIDLSETWADYDEKGAEPVTIDEVQTKFS